MNARLTCLLAVLALSAAVDSARADTILNPANPGNFTREGQQPFTPAPGALTLTDTSSSDRVGFHAHDAAASPCVEVDLVATFQVVDTAPNNADAGVRFVINDGIDRAVILGAVFTVDGQRALGLASGTDLSNPASWPAFVLVDWTNPTSVRLRRTAAGDAELVELNGAAPLTPVFLSSALLPPRTRSGATVEFGAFSVEAESTVVITEFYSEQVVAIPLPATGPLLAIGIAGLIAARRRSCAAGATAVPPR